MFALISQIELGKSILIKSKQSSRALVFVQNYYPSLSSFLNLLIPVIFVLAGIFLFLLLVGGGFMIVASGGNSKNVESGKNAITGAVIGFLVMFAAFWIIQIVQVITGVPILNSGL